MSDPERAALGSSLPSSAPETILPAEEAAAPLWFPSEQTPNFDGSDGQSCLPRRFGDYELLEQIGRGGMGVVYKARQTGLNRLVALKMIRDGSLAAGHELARFRREAEVIARLRHGNIVQIHEVGEAAGVAFFSLELAEGGSLDRHLNGTPWPAARAAALVEVLARAMHAAHQAGVVHRDLKPSNVLLHIAPGLPGADAAPPASRGLYGEPKISDFGLAKRLDDAAGSTASGAILGTPSYMAPEQARGQSKEVGPAADTYALGAILYELLTGRPPFKAATQMETVLQVIGDEPVPPRQLQPRTAADLETICLKCLRKEPGKRYLSALELAEDLHRFGAREPIQARPVGRWERGWRWGRRNPALAGLLAAVALTLTLGAGVASVFAVKARRAAARATEKEENANRKAEDEARQRERAEGLLYASRIGLALREWQGNNVAVAQNVLEATDRKRRGWEYDYLDTLFNRHGQWTILGHTNSVTSVGFSPDGKRLASASWDRTVKVWDAATGQEVLSLTGHSGSIQSVCFSPDGKRLASGSDDKTVKVWDAATGQETLSLKGHKGAIPSVCFSPDGKRLASGSGDWTVKVWDTATGQEALTLKGHTNRVTSVSFSPDGKRLASASADQTVRVWDAATGQEVISLKGHTFSVTSVCFSPDGKRLASGSSDKTIKMWEAATGQEVLSLKGHTGPVWSVCYSPDGKRLASGSMDGTVRVWDAVTGQELLSLKGHASFVTSLSFSPDGKRLASASWGKTVKVWDAETGQETLSLKGHTYGVSSVCFSPDGKRLASGSLDRTVKVWHAITGKQLLSLKGHTFSVTSVCFSPDGKRLASGSSDKTIKMWEAATGQALTLKGHTGSVYSVCFSPDSKRLASASYDQTVKVWDAATGQEVLTLKGHTRSVTSVCFSPDGKRLASGSDDKTVKVWDAVTGQEALSLKGHTYGVSSVCFSPDGKRLASASYDQTVKVWDAATGQEAFTLKGHTGWVRSVCFSPDGKRIASGSDDNTVRVWDAATGQEILSLKGHASGVTSVCVSPDGKCIASGSYDRTVKLWDAHAEASLSVEPDFAWHAAEARTSEAAGQWFAATFHLARLLSARPWDADLHVRRAYALARLGRPQQATIHYLHALALNPHARLWPAAPEASRRAEAVAASGAWPAAAAEFRLAAHQPDAKWEVWENLLLAQCAARQADASRQTLAQLLDRFENQPALSDRLVHASRMAPWEPSDTLRLVKVAERLVAGRRDAATLTLLGSAQYRGGRFEDAARTLQEAIQIHGKGSDADAWLFLAMAQNRRGQHDEARKWFEKFEGWFGKQRFQTWQARIRWQLLHQEAKDLVNTPPTMPRADPGH